MNAESAFISKLLRNLRYGVGRTPNYDIVIDALFGVGLSREITGIYREKIEWLNSLSGKKAALDIPSGISADDGRKLGCCFRADLTVTFGFMKRGMLLYPGREMCGEIKAAEIGITEESFLCQYPEGVTITGSKEAVSEWFLPRREDSHKGSFGKVLLIAGSADMPGAALLSGEAVLRSGAGMLQAVSPAENRELILIRLPEAIYRIWDDTIKWEDLLDWCDAVVIGPGIGKTPRAKRCMESVLGLLTEKAASMKQAAKAQRTDRAADAGKADKTAMTENAVSFKPLILDADALNLTAASDQFTEEIKKYTALGGSVIMTPHMAEFARLLHCGMEELREDRMGKIKEYCQQTGVILISKDAATVAGYCREGGKFCYYINQTGNNGMATAGSGDVLSGILGASAALMAAERKSGAFQAADAFADLGETGYERDFYFHAACRAVCLHGLSGDKAAKRYGKASMKAGDIINELTGLLAGL